MQIGILTFHNAHNYGAVWQAYALRTIIRHMGHSVRILNYRNFKISASYQKKLIAPSYPLSLLHPGSWLIWLRNHVDTWYAQPMWKQRCDAFEKFINEVLLENNVEEYEKADLQFLSEDVLICGSDQIWTDWLTEGDSAYFFDFPIKARKVAYGASRNNAKFSIEEGQYFREKLQSFSAISVREKPLADALTDLCRRKIEIVLDPSLLLSQCDYIEMESKTNENEKYILVYYLYEDEKLTEYAEKIAEHEDLKILEIHYKKMRGRKNKQIVDCGPAEWLAYIHHAEYILTNSFHGVAFSIIYHKDFYAVYEEDDRKTTLLNSLGLNNRHVFKEDICLQDKIDYTLVDSVLEEGRRRSVDFIKHSLK